MTRRRGRLAAALALGVAAVTLGCLWWRDSYVVGSAWWALRWVCGPLALGLLLTGLARRSRLIAAAATAALGLTLTDAGVSFATRSRPPEVTSSRVLRVSTHNLLFVGNDLDASLEGLGEHPADLLAFQEVTPGDAARLVRALAPRFPFHALAPHHGAHGFALFSTAPLSNVVLVPPLANTPSRSAPRWPSTMGRCRSATCTCRRRRRRWAT